MKTLKILGDELRSIGINAEYESWTGKIPNQYWIYTYIESDNSYETGCKEGVIILDGFSRDGISTLENEKEKIIEHFMDYRKTVDNTTVYLGSATGQEIDNTKDSELKRIEINIDFKEWRY